VAPGSNSTLQMSIRRSSGKSAVGCSDQLPQSEEHNQSLESNKLPKTKTIKEDCTVSTSLISGERIPGSHQMAFYLCTSNFAESPNSPCQLALTLTYLNFHQTKGLCTSSLVTLKQRSEARSVIQQMAWFSGRKKWKGNDGCFRILHFQEIGFAA